MQRLRQRNLKTRKAIQCNDAFIPTNILLTSAASNQSINQPIKTSYQTKLYTLVHQMKKKVIDRKKGLTHRLTNLLKFAHNTRPPKKSIAHVKVRPYKQKSYSVSPHGSVHAPTPASVSGTRLERAQIYKNLQPTYTESHHVCSTQHY